MADGSDGEGAAGSGLRLAETQGRWVVVAMVLGSAIAGLDATVVNVALPAIGRDFDAGVTTLQWTVTAYMLTLAALILVGGSLGDRYGRRRVFLVGTAWFTAASVLCGIAPGPTALIAARALQGVGGALVTPGSLAILQASFHQADRARAIGIWSAFAGIATATGPLVGGYLVESVSWRWVFLLNVPLAAVVALVTHRHVPESSDPDAAGTRLDLAGATLAVAGLAGTTYALVESRGPAPTGLVLLAGAVGLGSLAAFCVVERTSRHPMVPLDIFASRQFVAANVVTLVVYGALGGTFFLLAIYLQTALRYSPTESGLAVVPVTFIMLVLSERSGALSARIGPRLPMTAGPLLIGLGLWAMRRVEPGEGYLTSTLPAIAVFGLGLAGTVAPLTATVLGAVDVHRAGLASGINNAVARTAGLLAVAVLPALAGITGAVDDDPAALADSFRTAMGVVATLAASGGVIAWFTIRNDQRPEPDRAEPCYSCAVDAPPVARSSTAVG